MISFANKSTSVNGLRIFLKKRLNAFEMSAHLLKKEQYKRISLVKQIISRGLPRSPWIKICSVQVALQAPPPPLKTIYIGWILLYLFHKQCEMTFSVFYFVNPTVINNAIISVFVSNIDYHMLFICTLVIVLQC